MRKYYLYSSFFIVFIGIFTWRLRSFDVSETLSVNHAIFYYFTWCALYLIGVRLFRKSANREGIQIVLISAVVARLFFVFLPIITTSDIYRYLWEGYLVRSGVNPYLYAPEAAELLSFRTEYWGEIEHGHLAAIYPPVAQYLLALFCHTVFSWKMFLLGCEIATLYLILQILHLKRLPPGRVAYYALLPVPLLETVYGGHLEGALVPLMLGFVYLAELIRKEARDHGEIVRKRRLLLAGVIAAAAGLVKFVSFFPVAVYLVRCRKEIGTEAVARIGASTVLSCVILTAPFVIAGPELFASLFAYLSHWRFNDSFLHLLGSLQSVDWSDLGSFAHIKWLLLIVWILIVGTMIYLRASWLTISLYGFSLYLLLSAVFHPWYILWAAPFLCFVRSTAVVYLALAVPLAYSAQMARADDVAVMVKVIEFLPVYILLARRVLREYRRREQRKLREVSA